MKYGTPARTDVAEEPAAGNAQLHAFPLVAVARRVAAEIVVVDRVFEIDCEVRVHPNADTDAAIQVSIGRSTAVGFDVANTWSDVPAAGIILGLRYAHATKCHGDKCKQDVTFHRDLLST
jgi:hypothetical protein